MPFIFCETRTWIGENMLTYNELIAMKPVNYNGYVHGYSEREARRLIDQASMVSDYLHFDSVWDKGSRILEVGCGVGAQTEIIATKNPESKIIAIDRSEKSVKKAKLRMRNLGIENVEFRVQDIGELENEKDSLYDHVFICFVLEHLKNPVAVLKKIKQLIKSGGTITIIEGDHGSILFYPENVFSRKIIEGQIRLQENKGGNANIGRELYPLLLKAGYKDIEVSPRQLYVDNSKPKLVERLIKNAFIGMIQGMSTEIISEGILTNEEFEKGIHGLLRTTEKDGVFSCIFFKARGKN